LSVIDVGSGGGDMLRRIWLMARKRNVWLNLVGVDLNPWSKHIADELTPADAAIRFETSDIFAFDPSRRADFIVSSLFTHHLTDTELIRFIQWMDHHAVRGWFINDLHRHPIPYFVIKHAARILRLDPMVQHDGPVSVARAFTAAEWRYFLSKAGISAKRTGIKWLFPFRYCVSCRSI
jgi:2-polyprenyl-3-methyl-5-hydroxy-6-metoxy-1,4-benzoquinol methylase